MNIDRLSGGTPNTRTLGKTATHSLAALALLLITQPARAQTTLPPDVAPSCTVPAADFNRWFATGNAAKDGIVLPADSLSFTGDSACAFYRWSQQMFLWVTSPLGTGHVFETPQFYEVSPPDPQNGGARTLRAPTAPGQFLSFASSISLVGDKGQEVVFDSTGKVHNVVRPETGSTGRIALLNAANQLAEVKRVVTAQDGKPLLLDKTDRVIDIKAAPSGAPELRNESGALRDTSGAIIDLLPKTVLVNGRPALVTTAGAVIDTEQGQADKSVLMARNKSLVYYLLQVNDVLAYFKTGVQDANISPTQTEFPTSQDILDKITTVARQAPAPHTKQQFPDSNTLTMELKSSWVETTDLANPGDYITINTTVPTYTQSADNKTLTPAGTKPAKLALVGLHVVGSTNGHPEMIWATFEHVNNAPNRQYTYTTASGAPATKPADGAGSWLFSAAGASDSPPAQRMTVGANNTIVGANGQTIGLVDITRINPWGSDSGSASADTNTQVISINKSIIEQLATGDVRKNYILVGAIWTDGKPPGGSNLLGTIAISNSTMETFQQPGNCFDCHGGNMLGSGGGGLSHIWGKTSPLFP